MALNVHRPGAAYARKCIAEGNVNKSAAWSWGPEDVTAAAGDPPNADLLGQHHLAADPAKPADDISRFDHPIIKKGVLFKSALMACKSRATEAGDTSVANAAGALIEGCDNAATYSRDDAMVERKMIVPFEVKALNDKGQFEGYGSTFGGTPDYYGDLVAKGAFVDTLREHHVKGTYPVMLWSHDPTAPCGEWLSMAEDNRGLKCTGQLWVDGPNPDADAMKAYRGMKMANSMMGLSIGFKTKAYTYDQETDIRTLTKVDLFEVSPTMFPANEAARVIAVKGAARRVQTKREFEAFLRDEGGFSRAEAEKIARDGFHKAAIPEPRDEDGWGPQLAALRAAVHSVFPK